jgi:peptide/nickel transport system substrate-binding protein
VEVEPDLADKYEISADGLKYTFHLKHNVKFQDGTAFDADAVVFSVMRQMDDHHPYHVAGRMRYAHFLFGDPSTTQTALVTDVTAVNRDTVAFTLARPYVPFLKNLAMTPAAIVSPHAVQTYSKDFNTTMVGTGPFRLKSYQQDQSVVIVRNDQYSGKPPKLDEIRFRILRDPNVRLNSIRKGDSDIISGIEPNSMDLLKNDSNVTVLSEPSMNLGYIALNNKRAPFDNKLVRQAINYAIDKDYIVNTLFNGTSIVAHGIIPPGMLGYDPDRKGYPYDPAKAKQLLAQAGYPNGFAVQFTTHDRPRVYFPIGIKLAERIQSDLAKVGITAAIDQLEYPAFLEKTKSHDYSMANSGWVTDNGDPDNFLYELAGREDNDCSYSNPEATALMRQAAGERDEAKRAALYKKAEDLVVEDPPFVFLNHGKQTLAIRKNVKNLKLHPTAVTQLEEVEIGSD